MEIEQIKSDRLLRSGEVAKMFHVNIKTVSRWAKAGRLPFFWTVGGQRRYRIEDVKAATEASLTPSEVARIFGVGPKAVTKWARQGKLPCFETLGGHRRYLVKDVMAALKAAQDSD